MFRRVGAWLALVAMALNALWPMLAHASPRGFAAEMCVVNSVSALAQSEPPGRDLPQAPEKRTAAHCPFCANWEHSTLAAIVVAWSFLLPVAEAAVVRALPASASVSAGVLDVAASPRAPPAS